MGAARSSITVRRGANRLLTKPSSPHLVDKREAADPAGVGTGGAGAAATKATTLQIGAQGLCPRPFGLLGCVPEHASRPVDLNSQLAVVSQIPEAVPLPALFHLTIRGQAAGAQLARRANRRQRLPWGQSLVSSLRTGSIPSSPILRWVLLDIRSFSRPSVSPFVCSSLAVHLVIPFHAP